MSDAIDNFGLSCPKEAKFYVCKDKPTQFIGCCISDPCSTSDGNCPTNDLRAAGFDSKAFDKIPAEECISTDPEVKWYTCTGTNPPFLGCCGQNPCEIGSCPTKSLRGAKLSSDEDKANTFISGGQSMSAMPYVSTATLSPTLVVSSGTTSVTATPTGSAQNTTGPATEAPSVNRSGAGILSSGAIAGIGVASTAVSMLLVGLIILWLMKRRRKQSSSQSITSQDPPLTHQTSFHETEFSSTPDLPATAHFHSSSPRFQTYYHHPSPRHFAQHHVQHHELSHEPAFYTIYPDAYRNYMGTPPPLSRGEFTPGSGHFAPPYVPFAHPRTPPLPIAGQGVVSEKDGISRMPEYLTRERTEVAELGTSN